MSFLSGPPLRRSELVSFYSSHTFDGHNRDKCHKRDSSLLLYYCVIFGKQQNTMFDGSLKIFVACEKMTELSVTKD